MATTFKDWVFSEWDAQTRQDFADRAHTQARATLTPSRPNPDMVRAYTAYSAEIWNYLHDYATFADDKAWWDKPLAKVSFGVYDRGEEYLTGHDAFAIWMVQRAVVWLCYLESQLVILERQMKGVAA